MVEETSWFPYKKNDAKFFINNIYLLYYKYILCIIHIVYYTFIETVNNKKLVNIIMAKTPSTKTYKTVGKTTKTCKTVSKTTSNVKTDNVVVKRNLISWFWHWLTNAEADNKADETEADYEADEADEIDEADEAAEADVADEAAEADVADVADYEADYEADEADEADYEANGKGIPFYRISSITDGVPDDILNFYTMTVDGFRGYFFFDGSEKNLISFDLPANANEYNFFNSGRVAGYLSKDENGDFNVTKKSILFDINHRPADYKSEDQEKY